MCLWTDFLGNSVLPYIFTQEKSVLLDRNTGLGKFVLAIQHSLSAGKALSILASPPHGSGLLSSVVCILSHVHGQALIGHSFSLAVAI